MVNRLLHTLRLRTIWKKVTISAVFMLFLCTQIIALPFLVPDAAAELNWNAKSTATNFEQVMTFINCSDTFYTDGHTAIGESKLIWHRKISSLSWNELSKGAPLPLSDVAALSGNTSPNCDKLGPSVSKALFPDKPNTFLLDHFYNQGTDGNYYLAADYVIEGDGTDQINATAIANELTKLAGAVGFSRGDMPDMYRRWALKDGFSKCFHAVEGGSIFTIPPIVGHAGSKAHSYNYKDGTVKDDQVHVGMLVDDAAGDGKDGVWDCEEFANFIKNNPAWFSYVDKSESEIKALVGQEDAAAERQKKIDDIKNLLIRNQSVLAQCVASSNAPSGFANLPALGQINAITTALVNGSTTIPYSGASATMNPDEIPDFSDAEAAAGSTGTLDETVTGALLSCLTEKLPDLQEIIDREITSTYDAGDETEEIGPSCEHNSGILSWITCAVIDLISSVFNWVDTQIQALLGVDREKYTDDNMYKAWSAIRNIAFAVLVVIMLVMVIGTALGTQLFDAYTVKRAMPRMIIAIFYIALSWWINIFLIDLFNAIGNGTLGIMTSPWASISGDNVTFASLFQGGAAAAGASALGVGAVLGITGAMFILPGAAGILLSWIGTALLVIGIAFLVLVLRQMFIIVLTLFAPVAILAWIFPGNDKLWKLWWSSFSKLLMMFPLIMALIASGRIFSEVIGTTSEGVLSFIIKISAYVIPYALIPLTFKFAGGAFAAVTGMVNDRGKGAFDRLKNSRKKNYHKAGGNLLQRRAELAGRMQNAGSAEMNAKGKERSAFSRKLYRGGGRILGAGNVEAAMSARNAEEAKVINDQIATGRDDAIRGLTVDKKAIDEMGWEAAEAQGLVQTDDKGQRQYKTLGGSWVSEAAVVEGHQRWGKNQFAQQAALSYEMRKVNTREQAEDLKTRYASLATGDWGLSERQAGGNWIGAAFENQNTNLEYKYTDWKNGDTDAGKLADEIYEKKGSYPLSQMHAHTIEQLTNGHKEIRDKEARGETLTEREQETKKKIAAISETFVQRYATGAGVAGMEGETPVMGPPTPPGVVDPGSTTARTVSSGAGAVNEAVNELAHETGRIHTPPPENHRGPDSSQST